MNYEEVLLWQAICMIENLLLIKGYGKPHPKRWEEYETQRARLCRLHVFHPTDIPDFDGAGTPTRDSFRQYFYDFLNRKGLEPAHTVVEATSLGGNGWLDVLIARQEFRSALTRLIATPKSNRTGITRIDDFFPTPDLELDEEQRKKWLVIGSDNDNVINEHPSVLAAHLSVDSVVIPGAGHFMPKALTGEAGTLDLGPEWMNVRQKLQLPF